MRKRSKAQTFLRNLAKVLDRIETSNELASEDPLGFVDAVLGQSPRNRKEAGPWWELFGLDEKPTTRAELDGGWKRWAARNHPDQGGSDPAFRYMRTLYETHRERMKDHAC